jgi:GNAT superfamily N-acetyltransferase
MLRQSQFAVRDYSDRDFDATLAIQDECYGAALVESPATFRALLVLGMSFVAEDTMGRVIGFAIVQGHEDGAPLPLLHEPPQKTTGQRAGVFIHDLSVRREWRGRGVGHALAAAVVTKHGPASHITLVAVNGAERFWESCGWRRNDVNMEGLAASYGGPCTVMVRRSSSLFTK